MNAGGDWEGKEKKGGKGYWESATWGRNGTLSFLLAFEVPSDFCAFSFSV